MCVLYWIFSFSQIVTMSDKAYHLIGAQHLQLGDHIALKDKEKGISYYHEAIVESVQLECRTYNMIQRSRSGVSRKVYGFNDRDLYIVKQTKRNYNRQQTYERARSRLEEDGYHLTKKNCEHFAEWCVNGTERSYQAEGRPFGCFCYELIEKKKALCSSQTSIRINFYMNAGRIWLFGKQW